MGEEGREMGEEGRGMGEEGRGRRGERKHMRMCHVAYSSPSTKCKADPTTLSTV